MKKVRPGSALLASLTQKPIAAFNPGRGGVVAQESLVVTAAEPDPTDGVFDGYEKFTVQKNFLPAVAGVAPTQLVYRTLQRWRALDVYVDTREATLNNPTSLVSIGVFAVNSKGLRALVGSGRIRNTDAAGPYRVVVVRSPIAEHYEIEFGYNELLPLSADEVLTFTVVATDDAMPDDSEAGSVILLPTDFMGAGLSLATQFYSWELLRINAVSAVASRFVHVNTFAAAGAGVAPILSLPCSMPGSPGMWDLRSMGPTLRRRFEREGGLNLSMSSTAATLTVAAAGDWAIGAWIR